jgi:hypothetical protein
MSNRMQPYPPAGTRQATLRLGVQSPWKAAGATTSRFPDIHFLRTWLEYDSQVEKSGSRRGINWYAILGFMLVAGVSAGFWTGIGLIVNHLWK